MPETVPTRAVLGSLIANVEPGEAIALLEQAADQGTRGYVCLSNVHTTVTGMVDPTYREVTNGALMALPDGKPLVWSLRLLGGGPRERTNGPMLMRRMLARSPMTGHRHFLFGGADGVPERLRERFPAAHIVGAFSPPFRPPTAEEDREHAARIDAARPHFIWVGLGAPKQEQWMARLRPLLQAPILLGVGAAFDQLSGRKTAAPVWLGDRGLEWAYRLAQEPRRLGRRYLTTNPLFVAAVAGQWALERARALRPGRRGGFF